MIEKNTQFLEAVESGDKEKVIDLVNEDPTLLKYTMEDGFTAIHFASLEGHNEVIEYLISQGINVNVETNEGETAIHLAAYEGYNQTIELLCRNGAIFSPLEVYENLLEGIKLKIIEDKDVIKAIINNSMQVLEELKLIQLNAIEDSANSEVLENMLVNDFKHHPFIVPVIDNFIKKKINIENVSLQEVPST
ncbi:ankyrin repeat domain-containing protein [Holosporaceae bacterium 'Namur']|nr:ankyrin repeat domain-containing protein [Holosporaceae bacterium 'Namur']